MASSKGTQGFNSTSDSVSQMLWQVHGCYIIEEFSLDAWDIPLKASSSVLCAVLFKHGGVRGLGFGNGGSDSNPTSFTY